MTDTETSRATMSAYLDAFLARGDYARFFAPGVGLKVMGTDPLEDAYGPDGVERFLRYLYEQAFDAHSEIKVLLVDGEHAALEADFVGRHVAEFAGKATTGKEVRVPYSEVYDLEGGQIMDVRLYLSVDGILRQLEG